MQSTHWAAVTTNTWQLRPTHDSYDHTKAAVTTYWCFRKMTVTTNSSESKHADCGQTEQRHLNYCSVSWRLLTSLYQDVIVPVGNCYSPVNAVVRLRGHHTILANRTATSRWSCDIRKAAARWVQYGTADVKSPYGTQGRVKTVAHLTAISRQPSKKHGMWSRYNPPPPREFRSQSMMSTM